MVRDLGVPSTGLGVAQRWHQCCDERIKGGDLPLWEEGGTIEIKVVVCGGDDTPKIVPAHSVIVVWDFEEGWGERVG